MSELNISEQATEQAQDTTPEGQATTQDQDNNEDFSAKLEEAKKELRAEIEQSLKSEIGGLNRKVSEKDKEIKALEREKMSDAEKAKSIIDEANAIAAKATKEYQESMIAKHLFSVGLDKGKFANYIKGETEEEIESAVKVLNETIEARAKELNKSFVDKTLGGEAPKGGSAPAEKTITMSDFKKLSPDEQFKKMADGFITID